MDNEPLIEPEASKVHSQAQAPPPPPPLIIKADELDSTGTDLSTTLPTISAPITPALQAPPFHPIHSAQSSSRPNLTASPKPVQVRPILRREPSTPVPPSQPPPHTPDQPQQDGHEGAQLPTDSLSLQQLRRLVTEFPKLEPQAYAYEHADTRSFVEEVEEWFPYSEDERYLLLRARETFEAQWKHQDTLHGAKWIEADAERRRHFVCSVLQDNNVQATEIEVVNSLAYLALGCWGDTAGLEEEIEDNRWRGTPTAQFARSASQIKWMRRSCGILAACGAFQYAFHVLRRTCESQEEDDRAADAASIDEADLGPIIMNRYVALNQALTIMYMMIEVARWGSVGELSAMRQVIDDLQLDFLQYLTRLIARTRWQEAPWLPFTRLLLLYWKTILLLFGSSDDLKDSKQALRTESDVSRDERDQGFVTATPLDYHLFRQEITSKYPAYNPPPPILPIEPENNSILPPLPNHSSRQASQENLIMASNQAANGTHGSIFHQPVHIATPAPSPPPSPAGPGGKGGKKQNYQTNQNFPFLYPTLDETSNVVGGQGDTRLYDRLVGKRWEGSDVPASILEAGQLFASRMRMSRSIRQLWDVREQYIRHERGWEDERKSDPSPGSDGWMIEEGESGEPKDKAADSNASGKVRKDKGNGAIENEEVQRRLDVTENFYRNALPHLQSLVLVLWKVIFTNVSYLVTQANGQNGQAAPNGVSFPDDNPENVPAKSKLHHDSAPQAVMANASAVDFEHEPDPVMEELNAVRLREISTKAISAILLTLLRWFKLSHVLKFEYLTQLLLDANYLPLILKLFAHQDVDRAVDRKNDRNDLNFFHFCHVNSSHPPPPCQRAPSKDSSPDSAAPPPIPAHRRRKSTPPQSPTSPSDPPAKPTVDELGYPTAPLPSSPLQTYSPRFFHATIMLLSLLQKITKSHAHRSLLLVQYKSSTILRKYLRIPQGEMRRGVLKLFKQQVQFCGRKWRQGNMRVITSVYLHLGMRGLRDDWLSGGDVDAVVEEAVPVEWAWRGLVGWWHMKRYRDVLEGVELKLKAGKKQGPDADDGQESSGNLEKDDSYDFFARELDKMGWGFDSIGSVAGDEDDEELDDGLRGKEGGEWDSGQSRGVG
ncbi:MAG: hypothetical protein Q9209_005889 [Squamulea sp. 1 TL-2023]